MCALSHARNDVEEKEVEEKQTTIVKDVRKLKEVRFIQEIKYPTWLASMVMVKKPSRKWRMCIDFTNINQECPKDPYPLSNIYKLIDRAASYRVLSFMDAYSVYN